MFGGRNYSDERYQVGARNWGELGGIDDNLKGIEGIAGTFGAVPEWVRKWELEERNYLLAVW